MRQRQSSLMAKPADLSRLDKVLRKSQGLPSLSLIQTSFIMITICLVVLERVAFTHCTMFLNQGFVDVLKVPRPKKALKFPNGVAKIVSFLYFARLANKNCRDNTISTTLGFQDLALLNLETDLSNKVQRLIYLLKLLCV